MDNPTNPSASGPSSLEMTLARVPTTALTNGVPVPALPPPAPPTAPPGLAAAPSMGDVLAALRRRWLLALTSATLAASLAVAAVFFIMPPKYLAEGRLLVASKTDPNLLGSGHREATEFVIFKANLPSMLKAPLTLSSALNQRISPTKFARDLAIVRERGGDAIEWLDKVIKTDYNLGPEILKVTLSAERADEAAELLNAVVLAFLYDLEQKDKARADDLVEQYEKNKQKLEYELGQKRRLLAEREQFYKLPNLAEQAKKFEIVAAKVSMIEKDLVKNRLDREQAKQELETLAERQQNIDQVPVPDEQLDIF